MGLLIFVWDIYTELQNCMYQTAHGPCLSQSLLTYHTSFNLTSLTGNHPGTKILANSKYNKRQLAMGLQTPRLLCKFKY